jgi:hypothetical protein
LFFFFNHHGIVHYEFTPEGQALDEEFYLPVLRDLTDEV